SMLFLVGGVLAVLFALGWPAAVQAQSEEPVCPPGFEWQRRSGVGCVQVDCAEAGARYSYTSACNCDDELSACYEPVDYSDFDQENCGIFCPGSKVVACVDQGAACPGDELVDVLEPTLPPIVEGPSVFEPEYTPSRFEDVEYFIIGGYYEPPSPARAAMAAAASTLMLGTWAFLQRMAQRPAARAGKQGANKKRALDQSGGKEQGSGTARQAGAELFDGAMTTVDRWPGGGDKGEAAKIPPITEQHQTRPERSKPVSALTINPHEEVFFGEDALEILREMEKLPWTITKADRVRLGDAGLRGLSGMHPGSLPRRMTLPGGREIIVARVEAVAYADAPDPIFIEFSEKLALTAILVEEAPEDPLDAPTIRKARPDENDDLFDAPTVFRAPDEEDDDES
ncbi:MAG TPA: hypothetical protein VJ965_11095, partial [Anaerolineales bacterium]|nr:hypothetical protein [Anaerolineales bacterium]